MDSTPFITPDMLSAGTVVCPVRYHARANPDRNAILSLGQSLTYAELDSRIDQAAERLRERSRGDAPLLGIYRSDPSDTIVWLFAVLRLGGSAVFPGDRLPGGVLESIRALAPFTVLISAERIINVDVPVISSRPIKDATDAEARSSTDARSRYRIENESAAWTLSAPATWLYTSGSSGRPRLAVHSVRNHLLNAISANKRTSVGPDSRWLLSLPLFHVGGIGILFRVLVSGATVVIPEKAQTIDEALLSLRPTHVSLVSTQLRRLLTACPTSPDTLESVLVGGGPIDANVLRSAIDGGYPVRTTYGMTELSSQVATSEVLRDKQAEFTAGRPLEGTQVSIGEDGEVLVRTPGLFLGYASNDRIESPVTTDGWYATGDIGSLVGSELRILGRKDEMFISGGENIYPEEIERELNACEEVERAFVVPVRDEEYGFRPVAVVRWYDGRPQEAAVLCRLGKRLPKFKVPVLLMEWPESLGEKELKINRGAVKTFVQAAWSTHRDRTKS